MYIAVQEDSVVSLVSHSHSEDCVRTRLRKVVRSGRGRKRLLVGVVQGFLSVLFSHGKSEAHSSFRSAHKE